MIDASLYYTIYINLITICCFVKGGLIYKKTTSILIKNNNNLYFCYILAIGLVLYLGTRPISKYMGDTRLYALMFQDGTNDSSEFLWTYLTNFIRYFTDNVRIYFTIIEFIYIFCHLWACKRISKNNSYLTFLFTISSFSFYSYGINGIRNGAACSLVILALTYLPGNIRSKITAFILCFLAYGIHKSTALPSLCMLLSYYVVKDVRWTMAFWVIAIIISALFGSQVAMIFTGLGFDDRLDSYIIASGNEKAMHIFSQTGFRWDFLLYSAMPIWLGWYIAIRRKIYDRQYLLLLNTYILANAFWVMVITAAFSNRFAYLSWFIYPLLLAYPLVKFKIWKNQGEITALILMGHIGFTYIMYLIG